MKKNLVLFTLFIFPIVAYLFFASGVNGFIKLPVITKEIPEIGDWKTFQNQPIKLADKITILSFGGTNILSKKGNYFNLNQKIYERYREFKDFQIVVVVPLGTEKEVEILQQKLASISDTSGWYFVFASTGEISSFYKKLKLQGKLDSDFGTTNVYIVDKKFNLRGRKGKVDKEDSEYKEGYDTSLVSELHNKMTDDVRIILAEYRLALKQNNKADRKKYGL